MSPSPQSGRLHLATTCLFIVPDRDDQAFGLGFILRRHVTESGKVKRGHPERAPCPLVRFTELVIPGTERSVLVPAAGRQPFPEMPVHPLAARLQSVPQVIEFIIRLLQPPCA